MKKYKTIDFKMLIRVNSGWFGKKVTQTKQYILHLLQNIAKK